MKDLYKLVWDIGAVGVGLYIGWNIFIFSEEHIPVFGYVPIGIFLGLLGLGVSAYVVHMIDGLIAYLVWKFFRLQVYNDPDLHFK